jgi:hypothetical protein
LVYYLNLIFLIYKLNILFLKRAAGIIIYELVTLNYPFKESSNFIFIIESIKNDNYKVINVEISKQISDIIEM